MLIQFDTSCIFPLITMDPIVKKFIRRKKANHRERNRMHGLVSECVQFFVLNIAIFDPFQNETMDRLRELVPLSRAQHAKLSKIETLRLARLVYSLNPKALNQTYLFYSSLCLLNPLYHITAYCFCSENHVHPSHRRRVLMYKSVFVFLYAYATRLIQSTSWP